MRRNVIETVMGAVVLVVAGFFLFVSYSSSGVRTVDGYELQARFERVDGLTTGSDVRLAGIKVGTVTRQDLDPETYLAVVRFSVADRLRLPRDTSAAISSEGLLGGKYLSLVPGGDERTLEPGDAIRYTQAPVNLEQMIGQLIFSRGEEGTPPAEPKPQ